MGLENFKTISLNLTIDVCREFTTINENGETPVSLAVNTDVDLQLWRWIKPPDGFSDCRSELLMEIKLVDILINRLEKNKTVKLTNGKNIVRRAPALGRDRMVVESFGGPVVIDANLNTVSNGDSFYIGVGAATPRLDFEYSFTVSLTDVVGASGDYSDFGTW